MAIKLFTRYPGRADPASTDYPQGSFKNRSAPGVLDGTPLEKDWANDLFAFFQSLLKKANITPNDTVDTVGNSQYFNAFRAAINIPEWSNLVDYTVPSMVFGSDGDLYIALLASGPSTAPQDPISSPTYWRKIGQASLPSGYFYGLEIANNATDATNDIDINVGEARDATGTRDIKLPSILTKRLDAAWSAGNNQGGLFTGSKANITWYHVFLIINNTTGVVDVGFDTSISAANRPSGWSYRYLNSIQTDASGVIRPFLNFGLEMLLKISIRDVSVNSVAAGTTTNYTITTPPGIRVFAKLWAYADGADAALHVYSVDQVTNPLVLSNTAYSGGDVGTSNSGVDYSASFSEVLTNTSSQVKTTSMSTAVTNIAVVTEGWRLPSH